MRDNAFIKWRQTKPNQRVVSIINLLVLDYTRRIVGRWDGSYQTKPNQRVVTKIILLDLNDVEHELVVQ